MRSPVAADDGWCRRGGGQPLRRVRLPDDCVAARGDWRAARRRRVIERGKGALTERVFSFDIWSTRPTRRWRSIPARRRASTPRGELRRRSYSPVLSRGTQRACPAETVTLSKPARIEHALFEPSALQPQRPEMLPTRQTESICRRGARPSSPFHLPRTLDGVGRVVPSKPVLAQQVFDTVEGDVVHDGRFHRAGDVRGA